MRFRKHSYFCTWGERNETLPENYNPATPARFIVLDERAATRFAQILFNR
jgi:hypothetical protein